MMKPRTPSEWDDVFMEMCKVIAKRSKDPNTQVGAVIVDTLNRIVSLGFNGPPRLIVDTSFSWNRPDKYDYVKHAEDNALWFGSLARGWDGLRGTVLYCSHAPCPSCMLSIIRGELTAVVYDGSTSVAMLTDEKWNITKKLASLGSVALIDYSKPKETPMQIGLNELMKDCILPPMELDHGLDLDKIVKQQDEPVNEEQEKIKKEQEDFIQHGTVRTSSNWG